MIKKIPAVTRGTNKLSWLTSYHSFSFGNFFDAQKMNFGMLRVLNDDIIEGGGGFPLHPHDNMEIITLVLEGSLEHKDNTGGHGVLKAGEMQHMTAGSGIKHSEFNASQKDRVHLLQIWVFPREENLKPGYEQKEFASLLKQDQIVPVVLPEKGENTLLIHQDVSFFLAKLEKGAVEHPISENNGVYLFLIAGEVQVGNEVLKMGDAAEITDEKELVITPKSPSLCLLIETPIR
jgi:redox-sensitive bicupin YhaK (pirin superfamily)